MSQNKNSIVTSSPAAPEAEIVAASAATEADGQAAGGANVGSVWHVQLKALVAVVREMDISSADMTAFFNANKSKYAKQISSPAHNLDNAPAAIDRYAYCMDCCSSCYSCLGYVLCYSCYSCFGCYKNNKLPAAAFCNEQLFEPPRPMVDMTGFAIPSLDQAVVWQRTDFEEFCVCALEKICAQSFIMERLRVQVEATMGAAPSPAHAAAVQAIAQNIAVLFQAREWTRQHTLDLAAQLGISVNVAVSGTSGLVWDLQVAMAGNATTASVAVPGDTTDEQAVAVHAGNHPSMHHVHHALLFE